jgi:hypothetical protein
MDAFGPANHDRPPPSLADQTTRSATHSAHRASALFRYPQARTCCSGASAGPEATRSAATGASA